MCPGSPGGRNGEKGKRPAGRGRTPGGPRKRSARARSMERCVVLGAEYGPGDESRYASHLRSVPWLTYRHGFPAFRPYEITSDAGWGCMLRSAQMLLGTGLLRHRLGASWRMPKDIADACASGAAVELLRLFVDCAGRRHLFSIHNMIMMGMQYDKLPGEWYGPTTVSHVLRDLVNIGCAELGHDVDLLVVQGGVLHRDEVERFATAPLSAAADEGPGGGAAAGGAGAAGAPAAGTAAPRTGSAPSPRARGRRSVAREAALEDPLFRPSEAMRAAASKHGGVWDLPWRRAVMLLLPLRLGLQSIHAEYLPMLRETLRWPQSIGFVGGRPRHAIYFVGATREGGEDFTLLGLDPHTVQPAAVPADVRDDGVATESFMRSLRREEAVRLSSGMLDPSLALGFYCRGRAELEDLCERIRGLPAGKAAGAPLISVEDFAPNLDMDLDVEELAAASAPGREDDDDDEWCVIR